MRPHRKPTDREQGLSALPRCFAASLLRSPNLLLTVDTLGTMRGMHMALWGGRFQGQADPLFREMNDSLPFDFRLARQDIRGSIAWARAVHRVGVITAAELGRLVAALEALGLEVTNNPSLPASGQDEDVHSWVERRLIETLGPLGKKLHTGRSRNDQVATDLRLWVRDEIDVRLTELRDARGALIDLAQRELGGNEAAKQRGSEAGRKEEGGPTILSGYTHLQRAQPILFSHWALAYEAMLERDTRRFIDARTRVNVCPLGSGALAGTGYAIDRVALARDLGFDAPTTNSLDAVSDRDFVIEALAAAAITSVHLSRLGEDLILYGSQEFGLIEFDDSVSSGSSLMPQKKNPDAAELLRGKAGRVVGSLVSLLVTVKGLPLAYNKDLQEDKEPIFDAMDHVSVCLRIVPRIMSTLKVKREPCRRAALDGHSNATDLADYLVSKGVAFREAHDIVGLVVRRAIERATSIDALPLDELRSFSKAIGPDVYESISLAAGLARREVLGGTGPNAVAQALKAARQRLDCL
jgi:argininosuccinate lyase